MEVEVKTLKNHFLKIDGVGCAMLSLGTADANGVQNPLPQLSSVMHVLAQFVGKCETNLKWKIVSYWSESETIFSPSYKQFQRCVTECLIILKSTLWGDEDLKHKIIDL